ncbi:CDP-alcohol phosphatidyltransferase family protein [Sphingomicrobium lutaoense]|uniref:CDP-diacylglycerol--serine O-phosphatidyltransferase n=1 Tax=Sphingomicrobium lutaoense TaxID=515949 RepID=A0A839YZR2_9SPHN|nr:phosphatidylcholine/phosphatidylserine synthase [Sphingomicrobium lutaoense]MBB3763818.1 CDP-diacylglycerol--serine O-phosphatidyltransferase [Sphingomicrobium lutaoense]
MTPEPVDDIPARRGLPFRALAPNAITALALCLGLTGVRFAVDGNWEATLYCIIGAGVLDGMDGRIARLLKAASRFGAELDSLSDNIAFGVAPALIMFLWSLQYAPKFGWIASLALAVCCALRLARFNAQIDADEQPHKSAGFLTGVPAPTGAGLAFVPLYAWLISGDPIFRAWYVVMPWVLFVALLMISSIATYSWSSLRLRRSWRIPALAGIGLLGAALLTMPWVTLLVISIGYLAMLPFSVASYRRVKQRRATQVQ